MLEPADGWARTTVGEQAIGSGGAVPVISDVMRLYEGQAWPARATWRGNIDDWFFVPEDDQGYLVFFHHGIGHDDGWDETIFTLEGRSISVRPAVHEIDGRAMYGSAVRVRGLTDRWGWANFTARFRPRRGYESGVTYRLWLNRKQAVRRPAVILAAPGDAGGDRGLRRFATLGDALGAGSENEQWLESGWDVRVRPGAQAAREGAIVRNRGPIRVLPDEGVAPRDFAFTGRNGEGNVQINARRVSFFDCRFALWGVAAFRTPHAMPPSGMVHFRDGCSLRDAEGLADFEAARAGGPLDAAGLPIGLPGNWRSHRFFNQAGTDGNVAMIGGARPVDVRMTHALSGVRTAYRTVGEFGWSLSFPLGNDLYSNTGCLACEFTGFSNYWIRLHAAPRLTVSGPPQVVRLGGVGAIYRVPVANGPDLPRAAPISGRLNLTGDPGSAMLQIPLSQQGQWWARCYTEGQPIRNPRKGWPSDGQYLDGIGPDYPPDRDGSRDFPDLGFACVGAEPGYVYLLNNPGPLSEITLLYAHGSHSIFVQGDPNSSPAPARNIVYAYCAFEHPEAYIQLQHGGTPNLPGGSNRVTVDAAGIARFSASITCFEGQFLRIMDGAARGTMVPIRRGTEGGTEALVDVHDINPETGASTPLFRRPIENASFEVHRAALQGLDLTNIFTSGSTAIGTIDGTLGGLVIRNATLRQETRYPNLKLGVLLRPELGSLWQAASIADSYVSGLTLVDSGGVPSAPVRGWFRNNQWGSGRNFDRGARGTTGQADFARSRAGRGISAKASKASLPVDRLGRPREPGVSPVGSDIA